MSLSLTTRTVGTLCYASLSGHLTLSDNLVEMSGELTAVLTRSGSDAVVLNVADISEVDSAGLGELVNIYKSACDHQIRIALTGVHGRLREMLVITHVDVLLPAYASDEDAASALREPS